MIPEPARATTSTASRLNGSCGPPMAAPTSFSIPAEIPKRHPAVAPSRPACIRSRPRNQRRPAATAATASRSPSAVIAIATSLRGAAWPGASVTLDRYVARPTAVIATARSSRDRGSFRSSAARTGMASTRPTSRSGCTNASEPERSAVAWSSMPKNESNVPVNHQGFRARCSSTRPTLDTPRGTPPAARCWRALETAKAHAALRAITAATVACWSMGAPVLGWVSDSARYGSEPTQHLGRIPGIGRPLLYPTWRPRLSPPKRKAYLT